MQKPELQILCLRRNLRILKRLMTMKPRKPTRPRTRKKKSPKLLIEILEIALLHSSGLTKVSIWKTRNLTVKRTPMRANKSLRLLLTEPEKRKKLTANWTNPIVTVTTRLTKRLHWEPKRPAVVLKSRPFLAKCSSPGPTQLL